MKDGTTVKISFSNGKEETHVHDSVEKAMNHASTLISMECVDSVSVYCRDGIRTYTRPNTRE
jgi:hypothetical protein